ncbi:ACT domain-containing protein [Estrella lausannensis]|uniref:Uncharacterized protein n=1 Tax=Estrella lausannensis TaxID=483423 RepID=A0A0H5DTM0_9BACT|nr:ACT domain-containing protein [Estrella lausannensis]CRX39214.1 Conserved hypothetical protein [Estrella lausannensis]
MPKLTLSCMPDLFAIARLNPLDNIPAWSLQGSFFAITKTEDELSIVCQDKFVPNGVKVERGWRGFKVEGPLDFGLTGILSSLTKPLAEAKISIFALSTFDTDYLLVKQENLEKAATTLATFCTIIRG